MSASPADDTETRAAVTALVHRLRNRGEADGQYAEDDELFAQEFVTALRSRGWRPVLAYGAEADWRRASGGGGSPDAGRPGGAALAALKAARGWGSGPQPALTENDTAAGAAPAAETRLGKEAS